MPTKRVDGILSFSQISIMENSVASYVSAGGVSGAVVCVFYFLYKCLYKKKIHSECCGNTMDIRNSQSSPDTSKKEVLVVDVV